MSKEVSLEIVPASAPVKAPSLISGDDEKVAAQFAELFHDAQNGMRRVVAFGIFAWQIKLTKLKHGKFGPWVEANFAAKGISYRTVRAHMQLTESALEACGIKGMKAFFKLAAPLPFSHCGELLLLAETKVPEAAKPLREKLCSLIDGKSARSLFTEFKQDDGDEESPNPKRGNLKSKGRAPKQASPQELLEAERKMAREDINAAIDAIAAVKAKFIVLSDSKSDETLLTTFLAALEQQQKAVSAWVNKPADKRDAKKIEDMFKS